MNPETASWLDGPSFVEFLKEHRVKPHWADETWSRKYRHWRAGVRVRAETADELLLDHGLTLHDIPDDCWVPLVTYANRHPEWMIAGERYQMGADARMLAKEYGVNTHTIRRWGKDLRTYVRNSRRIPR